MRVPDFITTEDVKVSPGSADSKTLPSGAFVKPIHPYYLPKHIKESEVYQYCDHSIYAFAYSHFGIIMIEKTKIRQVN
jgi:hypothetical protein